MASLGRPPAALRRPPGPPPLRAGPLRRSFALGGAASAIGGGSRQGMRPPSARRGQHLVSEERGHLVSEEQGKAAGDWQARSGGGGRHWEEWTEGRGHDSAGGEYRREPRAAEPIPHDRWHLPDMSHVRSSVPLPAQLAVAGAALALAAWAGLRALARRGKRAPPAGAAGGEDESQLGELGLALDTQSIDLSRSGVGTEGAALLARLLPQAAAPQRLVLRGNPSLGDRGAEALAQALSGGFMRRGSQLRALDLSGCGIGDPGAAALAGMLRRNRTLEELDLSDNLIDAHGAAALGAALAGNRSLRALHIGKNYVGEQGAEGLAAGLRRNRALQDLYLNDNQLGDTGVRAICKGLEPRASGLQVLDLSKNGFGPAGSKALADLLQGCGDIRAVLLSHNELGDKGACQIASALRGKRRLRTLALEDCCVGHKGAVALTEALAGNKCLRALRLSSNRLGGEAVAALAEAVKEEPMELEELQLRGVGLLPPDIDAVVALFALLHTCPSLQLLDLRQNEFGDLAYQRLNGWCVKTRLQELEAGPGAEPSQRCTLLLTPP